MLETVSLAFLFASAATAPAQVELDTLRQSDRFTQRLTEPHSGLIDGTEFREAIRMVAMPGAARGENINFWIDRRVNPNTPVSPGGLGPTRYASLAKISEEVGCICFPTENCVLIGRPSWIAEILKSLSTRQRSTSSNLQAASLPRDPIDVHWPMLSTPTEARNAVLRAAVDGNPVLRRALDATLLPHDLWPDQAWSDLSPDVALRLIEGQFLSPNSDAGESPAGSRVAAIRSYQFAGVIDWIQKESANPATKWARTGKLVRVDANLDLQARLCRWLLSRRVSGLPSGNETNAALANRLKSDSRTFTLTVKNQPAKEVLRALASQLNVGCEFADANPAFDRRVSFEAVDQTLWDLVRLIAKQASLKIRVGDGKLHVSADA